MSQWLSGNFKVGLYDTISTLSEQLTYNTVRVCREQEFSDLEYEK